jgi:hypothetical protein
MSFPDFNAGVTLALPVAVAYLPGASTGGSLFAPLRRSTNARDSMMVST